MDSETDKRLVELLKWFESMRVSVNFIVAFVLLIAGVNSIVVGVPWKAAITAVPALGSAPVLGVLLIVLSVVAFSVANLLTRGITWVAGGIHGRYAVRVAAETASRARVAEQAQAATLETEQHQKRLAAASVKAERMRAILPHLSPKQVAIVGSLFNAPNHRCTFATLAPDVGNHLALHGIIEKPIAIDSQTSLYQLTGEALPVVTAFVTQLRAGEAEIARANASEAIRDLGSDALPILSLFGDEVPDAPDAPQHPWIEANAYQAVDPLAKGGVLIRSNEAKPRKGERYARDVIELAEVAVPLVADAIGRPVRRTRIVLDLTQIGSNVGRGSGIGLGLAYPPQSGGGYSPRR